MKNPGYLLTFTLLLMAALGAIAAPVSLDAHRELLLKQASNESLDATQRLIIYDSIEKLGGNLINPEIFREKALLWRKLRNINKELECFQSAIKATPKDSIRLKCRLYIDAIGVELRAKKWDELFQDALILYKLKKPDSLIYYDVLVDVTLAEAFERLENLDKADTYTYKARNRLKNLSNGKISNEKLIDTEISLLLKEGNIALDRKDYDTALIIYKKAKALATDEETHQLMDASIALILQRQGNFELGLTSAEENLQKYRGSPNGPTAALNLVRLLIGLKDAKRARQVLADYADEFNLLDTMTKKGSFEVTLTELNMLEGNYKEALDHLITAYETLEMQFVQASEQYSSTLDSEIIEWEKEQAAGKQIKWRNVGIISLIILAVFISGATVLFILFRKRYGKLKIAFKDCEKQKSMLEDNRSQTMKAAENALEERASELSKITMNLAIIQELIDDIRMASASRQMSDKEAINHIRLSLKQFRSQNDIWNLFKGYFEKLNQDFFNRLYRLHPDLSNAEIRMCAFIQMGLTTKEISAMTNRSPRTVNCIKYNLRKKCGITISTEEYLRRIAVMSDYQMDLKVDQNSLEPED